MARVTAKELKEQLDDRQRTLEQLAEEAIKLRDAYNNLLASHNMLVRAIRSAKLTLNLVRVDDEDN